MKKIVASLFAIGAACWGRADFRPPAVPLVCVDPHFSLWSPADRLHDAETAFWTGRQQPFSLVLEADGARYRLCGRSHADLPALTQDDVEVGALCTTYEFEGPRGLEAEVAFVTPRLPDDLDVFSRPVTYVSVRVKGAKSWRVEAEISPAFATNDDAARMIRTDERVAGLPAVKIGRAEQAVFSDRGDGLRPQWGYAWLVGPSVRAGEAHFLLAYDDVSSVRFMGRAEPAWWRRNGKSFAAMLEEAERDYPALAAKCRAFDERFEDDAERVGGDAYADVAALAWRQSFGACKFTAGANGEPRLYSNENGSGGMIGTTDVFYPQFPHLLLTSLTLAKGSLAPTCDYAASTNWPYPYAPHDLGLFPVAEGQHYGMKRGQSVGGGSDDKSRMPVEECGNMLVCLGAVAEAEGHAAFASRWWPEVTKWAEYLAKFGYDPGEQLCTDDFAGHLAHNANLSLKAILGLKCYSRMAEMRGEKAVAAKYAELARKSAAAWLVEAAGGAEGATRLAFDRPNTWSMKYNLVWDRLLGYDLFPRELAEREMAAYRRLALKYGLPLDNRKPYTKADWAIWCGSLTWKRADLEFFAEGVRRFLHETPDRTPFGDWYMADTARFRSFKARSVVGGVFLPMLQHPELVKRYRAK